MTENLKFNKKLKGKASYSQYDNYDAIEVPFTNAIPRSLSDNRYECLIFCGVIMQKKQDWACKTTSQITHS